MNIVKMLQKAALMFGEFVYTVFESSQETRINRSDFRDYYLDFLKLNGILQDEISPEN